MQTTSGDDGLSLADFFLGLEAFCIEPCMVFPIDGVVGLLAAGRACRSGSSNRWLTCDESVLVGSFSAIYLSDVKVGPASASMAGLLSRRLHEGKTERVTTR